MRRKGKKKEEFRTWYLKIPGADVLEAQRGRGRRGVCKPSSAGRANIPPSVGVIANDTEQCPASSVGSSSAQVADQKPVWSLSVELHPCKEQSSLNSQAAQSVVSADASSPRVQY